MDGHQYFVDLFDPRIFSVLCLLLGIDRVICFTASEGHGGKFLKL